MNRLLFLVSVLFILPPMLQAQNKELSLMAPYVLAGKWTGKIKQQAGGIAEEYIYEISLKLNGNNISGTGVIKTGSMYGYFELSGKLNGNSVQLEDLRITNENIRDRAAWCIKKMKLRFLFKDGHYVLEGPWSGYSSMGNCSPGNIYLKKEAIRA